jgi:hypothetical protein
MLLFFGYCQWSASFRKKIRLYPSELGKDELKGNVSFRSSPGQEIKPFWRLLSWAKG